MGRRRARGDLSVRGLGTDPIELEIAMVSVPKTNEKAVQVPAGGAMLAGNLSLPREARGLVLFAHGSRSSRHSPRNRYVAERLNEAELATLLIDLDDRRGAYRPDYRRVAVRHPLARRSTGSGYRLAAHVRRKVGAARRLFRREHRGCRGRAPGSSGRRRLARRASGSCGTCPAPRPGTNAARGRWRRHAGDRATPAPTPSPHQRARSIGSSAC